MEFLKEVIRLSPYILAGFSALVFALAYLVKVRADMTPGVTWEDQWAPTLSNISNFLFQAIEWLGKINGWTGATKLNELMKLTQEAEALWMAGRKTEAFTKVVAFYLDAKGKAEVANLIPPASVPPLGSLKVGDSKSL